MLGRELRGKHVGDKYEKHEEERRTRERIIPDN